MSRLLALTLVALLSSAVVQSVNAETKEPLTIKGVSLGDSMEKATQIGICKYAFRGTCIGKTTFGQDSTADFTITFVDGKVNSVMIRSKPGLSPEILAGLSGKYGESKSRGPCKPDAICHSWNTDGVTLLLLDELGTVMLTRAQPAGGY